MFKDDAIVGTFGGLFYHYARIGLLMLACLGIGWLIGTANANGCDYNTSAVSHKVAAGSSQSV